MNLYEAIFIRKSVRKYRMEPFEDSVLDYLNLFIQNLQPLLPEISVDFLVVNNCKDNGFKGVFSAKAPYYLLISSELKKDYLLNVGFLMEQIVLYLTSKGIGTCYQGALKPDILVKAKMKHDFVIGIAFGISTHEIYREPKKAKRLSEKEMIVYKEEPNDMMRTIMSAAMFSPSSFNNQPWRFVVYQNRFHVFCKKGYFRKSVLSDRKLIDIGVMLSHVVMAAEELWFSATFTDLDNIKDRQFKNIEYISSVIIKEE